MRREDFLSEIEVAFREAFPDRLHRLLREVERWCREAPDPASRDWRWFDGGDDAGKGKFDRDRVAAFRCAFCTRSLLDAGSLIGMCVDPERGGPRFTLEGYRHPVDQRPSGERRPEMMCNFCRDTYHERFADLELFGSGLPDADMLIADAARALRSRRPERAEETIRELERRRALSVPRRLETGTCSLCATEGARIVRCDALNVCSRCIGKARYAVSNVVAVSARAGR